MRNQGLCELFCSSFLGRLDQYGSHTYAVSQIYFFYRKFENIKHKACSEKSLGSSICDIVILIIASIYFSYSMASALQLLDMGDSNDEDEQQ